jgi:outer membrane protein OmpA-like peptidoglycan-associated protein
MAFYIRKYSVYYFSFLFIIFYTDGYCQENTYGIKNPGNEIGQKCSRCFETFRKKPIEVQVGTLINDNEEILFFITNPAWVPLIFSNRGDGITVDLVSKDQYVCGQKNKPKKSWLQSGTLMPPLYTKDLKKNGIVSEDGVWIVKIGDVPPALKGKELEPNMILIQDNFVCQYQKLLNVPAYAWDLLDMGMYMDSLVYNGTFSKSEVKLTREVINDKRMKFIIPFQKNKYEYSKEDIKPIYDSLNLTDYNIKTITIKAFSSVEGSEEKNIELQEKRAASLVSALQSYQKPTIGNTIHASENWVEFYKDLAETKYSYLTVLTKNEIKEQLKNKKLNDELEPYLKLHRKAVLIIELDKKNTLENIAPEMLTEMFVTAVNEKNISRAQEIQNSVFNRIRNNQLPSTFASNLNIPKQIAFGQLMINRASFNYFIDPDAYATYLELQELEDLLPKDKKIKYNLCVMMFKLMLQGEHVIKTEELNIAIGKLKSYGIPIKLVNRMYINYNIIMCEFYMRNGDYLNKDKCLKYIQANYRNVPLTDQDRVSMAQYLSLYGKYDWATAVLESQINKLDAEENLIFYYLNLTIGDPKITNKENYRLVMLNALNSNKERYCKMFNSVKKDGVTFQLLDNEFLKKNYCENCTK